MELFEAIAKRHSYRGTFTDQPVPREDLERIVEAGICAPSGCNAQTTQFIIVDDPALLSKLAAMNPNSPTMRTARAVIVVVADWTIPTPVGMSFQVEDYAAATQNMLLAVTALGYATVWLDGWLRTEGRAQAVADLLGVPEGREVRVLLPLGVPTEQREQNTRKPFGERVWYNRYGG
ncbi:MAG TPA: nitroreductase [Chloroflexi bacterium]|mgnify:CR=1 FL=1|nr:nitroreductase [Chloroflexota bacterium]